MVSLSNCGTFCLLSPPGKNSRGAERVPGVKVFDHEPFETALRRFKKQCEHVGILSEVRKRQYFEKPSVKRKKKTIAAQKRVLRSRSIMRHL